VKRPTQTSEVSETSEVYYADLWGLRAGKYRHLWENGVSTTEWQALEPVSPHFFFVPKDFDLLSEYERGWSIADVFRSRSTGFVTGRDRQLIAYTREDLTPLIESLINDGISNEEIAERYGIKDTSGWPVSRRRLMLIEEGFREECFRLVNYRPFDRRYTYYHSFLQRARFKNLKRNYSDIIPDVATLRRFYRNLTLP